MRNTQRNLSNIPVNLEGLVHLEDVDMSQNELTKIPEGLLSIPNIKRLNLGSNQITEISTEIERWQQMETLILSRNKIKVLPPGKDVFRTLNWSFIKHLLQWRISSKKNYSMWNADWTCLFKFILQLQILLSN